MASVGARDVIACDDDCPDFDFDFRGSAVLQKNRSARSLRRCVL